MAGTLPGAATCNCAGITLIATGGDFGNVDAELDVAAVLDENDAVDDVAAVLAAEGARCTDPVVIANGWLPAGK